MYLFVGKENLKIFWSFLYGLHSNFNLPSSPYSIRQSIYYVVQYTYFQMGRNHTTSYDWSDPDARCRFRWYHNNTVIVTQWTVHKRAEARSPVHMRTSAPTARDPPIWYILLAMKPAFYTSVDPSHCGKVPLWNPTQWTD